MKKRRARRKHYNWEVEIARGNTDKFYNSTDWDEVREKAFERDKGKCQFFLGKWDDGTHKPYKYKLVNAEIGHHIVPIKERPDLALDVNNIVSLSFEAHEIIEGRTGFRFRKKKNPLTEERW